MALESTVDEPLRLELFEIAAREAGKLEKLTTDFLSYAHTRPPDRRPVQVCTVLRYVASLARAHASGDAVTIVVACHDDLEADIDQFQVQQALLNLTLNAIEATAPGRTVTLGATRGVGATLSLYVENEGEAVAPEASARIFEPFFTTRPDGTGLGLAITRNIARAHGGDAALDVNEPGRVRFTITLPASAGAPALDGVRGTDGAYSRR
jgi:signal transduction histidine kinase